MARKEVHLDNKTIKQLQKLADKDDRKLKPYMEKVLREHALRNSLYNESLYKKV